METIFLGIIAVAVTVTAVEPGLRLFQRYRNWRHTWLHARLEKRGGV